MMVFGITPPIRAPLWIWGPINTNLLSSSSREWMCMIHILSLAKWREHRTKIQICSEPAIKTEVQRSQVLWAIKRNRICARQIHSIAQSLAVKLTTVKGIWPIRKTRVMTFLVHRCSKSKWTDLSMVKVKAQKLFLGLIVSTTTLAHSMPSCINSKLIRSQLKLLTLNKRPQSREQKKQNISRFTEIQPLLTV